MEATKVGETSIVVSRKCEKELACAIIELYENHSLRQKLGVQGRKFVNEMYEIDKCFKKVEKTFNKIS